MLRMVRQRYEIDSGRGYAVSSADGRGYGSVARRGAHDWHRRATSRPHALDGLGRNHSLPTALADLVDNSIDAHATHVLIRSVRQDGRLRAPYVVDNGDGIRPGSIDDAMTVGSRREYAATDLGRFGLGMKAASFSQARSMTVLSKVPGDQAVGRRWLLKTTSGTSNAMSYRPSSLRPNLDLLGYSLVWTWNGGALG